MPAATTPIITSTNEDVLKVEDGKLVAVGVGQATITVTAPGNTLYKDAAPVTEVITVDKGVQTIEVVAPQAGTEGQQIVVEAEARSGLPVTLTSTTPSVCEARESAIVLKSTGNCVFTASQQGSPLWEAAPDVEYTVKANPKPVGPTNSGGPSAGPAYAMSVQLVGSSSYQTDLRKFDAFKGDSLRVAAMPTGIASGTIVDGQLRLTPDPKFSGRRVVNIEVERDGVVTTVPIEVVVNPTPAANVVVKPSGSKSSTISWKAAPNATSGYAIYVNGKQVGWSFDNSIKLNMLIGPRDQVEIRAHGGDATMIATRTSQVVLAQPLPLTTIRSTGRSLASTAKLAAEKAAATIQARGFSSVTVTVPVGPRDSIATAKAKAQAVAAVIRAKTGVSPLVLTPRATAAQIKQATASKTTPAASVEIAVR